MTSTFAVMQLLTNPAHETQRWWDGAMSWLAEQARRETRRQELARQNAGDLVAAWIARVLGELSDLTISGIDFVDVPVVGRLRHAVFTDVLVKNADLTQLQVRESRADGIQLFEPLIDETTTRLELQHDPGRAVAVGIRFRDAESGSVRGTFDPDLVRDKLGRCGMPFEATRRTSLVSTDVKDAVERLLRRLDAAPHVYLTDDDLRWFRNLSYADDLIRLLKKHRIVAEGVAEQKHTSRPYLQRLVGREALMTALDLPDAETPQAMFWRAVAAARFAS
jgi:hypothetical protein